MNDDGVADIKRHFGVVVEGLRDEIRAVAEGQTALRDEVRAIGAGQVALRDEVRKEFDETKAMIRLSHGELERRVVDLESGSK